jgi:hypothetical protein
MAWTRGVRWLSLQACCWAYTRQLCAPPGGSCFSSSIWHFRDPPLRLAAHRERDACIHVLPNWDGVGTEPGEPALPVAITKA